MFALLKNWLHPAEAPLDPAIWRRVEARLPALDMLNSDELHQLEALALQFLAEKELSGGNNFAPSNDVRLEVALSACLPILKLGLEWYAGWVEVIIYEGDFVVPRRNTDAMGVQHEYQDVLAGEAWQGGPVVVSWFQRPTPGVNAAVHEFAHKLDMRNGGAADGLPPLHADMSRQAWSQVFTTAYNDFRQKVHHAAYRGRETELDPYAATSPAEFFAVMSEAFFETPQLLLEEYPAVYEQLTHFYRQDPAPREAALGKT